MAAICIAIFTVLNCFVVFLAATLAVNGDGTPGGMFTVLAFGGIGIAICTSLACWLNRKKYSPLDVLLVLVTLPICFFVGRFVFLGVQEYTSRTVLAKELPEFDAACKTAGAEFVAPPKKAVRSIAFDHENGLAYINNIAIDASNRVLLTSYKNIEFHFPPAVQTFETRHAKRLPDGATAYTVTSSTRQSGPVDIPALSADVLVKYRDVLLGKKEKGVAESDAFWGHEVTVVDRRDNSTLAVLKYFTYFQYQRACGPTENSNMYVGDFIAKAIELKS